MLRASEDISDDVTTATIICEGLERTSASFTSLNRWALRFRLISGRCAWRSFVLLWLVSRESVGWLLSKLTSLFVFPGWWHGTGATSGRTHRFPLQILSVIYCLQTSLPIHCLCRSWWLVYFLPHSKRRLHFACERPRLSVSRSPRLQHTVRPNERTHTHALLCTSAARIIVCCTVTHSQGRAVFWRACSLFRSGWTGCFGVSYLPATAYWLDSRLDFIIDPGVSVRVSVTVSQCSRWHYDQYSKSYSHHVTDRVMIGIATDLNTICVFSGQWGYRQQRWFWLNRRALMSESDT